MYTMNEDKIITDLLPKVSFRNEEFFYLDETWNEIRGKIIHAKRPYRSLKIWCQAAAAAAVIVLGIVLGFEAQVKIVNTDGVQTISLPDGSSVELSAYSTIHYNRLAWAIARNVRLKGDAVFSVTKGPQFRVKTDVGSITVLGTQFLVTQDDAGMNVNCYEGSVRIKTDAGSEIIHPGDRADCSERGIVISKIPQMLPEYVEYVNTPLEEIIHKIEGLYGLDVTGLEYCRGVNFTGYISTSSLQEAAKVLFECCGLGYRLDGNKLIIGE